VYQQLTAAEQAARDKYDTATLNVMLNASMFAFDPLQVHNNILNLEAMLDDLTAGLTTEFPATNHACTNIAMRAARISSERLPQPLDLLELLFISQFAKATAATLNQCLERRIKDSEGGFEAYIATFQTEITTIRRNPAISPSPTSIYNHLVQVIQAYSREAYNHLNTIMLTTYPDEMDHTIEALIPHAQKYFTARRTQASMNTLSSTRTRSPVKPLARAYKPQVRISMPPSGKTVYPAHYAGAPSSSTYRRNSPPRKAPCSICHQHHDGYACPLSAPGITAPPGWITPQAGTTQFLLFQTMQQLGQAQQQLSQPQQRSDHTSYNTQPPPRSYNSKQGKGSFYTNTEGPSGGGRPEAGDDTHDGCFMSDTPGDSHFTTRQSAQRTAPAATAATSPRAAAAAPTFRAPPTAATPHSTTPAAANPPPPAAPCLSHPPHFPVTHPCLSCPLPHALHASASPATSHVLTLTSTSPRQTQHPHPPASVPACCTC
jgi:hypothetical protein